MPIQTELSQITGLPRYPIHSSQLLPKWNGTEPNILFTVSLLSQNDREKQYPKLITFGQKPAAHPGLQRWHNSSIWSLEPRPRPTWLQPRSRMFNGLYFPFNYDQVTAKSLRFPHLESFLVLAIFVKRLPIEYSVPVYRCACSKLFSLIQNPFYTPRHGRHWDTAWWYSLVLNRDSWRNQRGIFPWQKSQNCINSWEIYAWCIIKVSRQRCLQTDQIITNVDIIITTIESKYEENTFITWVSRLTHFSMRNLWQTCLHRV